MASRNKPSQPQNDDHRLSRIRENQRRSRARRREYLEELESRWRKCQDMGVQANVELQKAARKVANENKVLWEMLKEVGIEEEKVKERLKLELQRESTLETAVSISPAQPKSCLASSSLCKPVSSEPPRELPPSIISVGDDSSIEISESSNVGGLDLNIDLNLNPLGLSDLFDEVFNPDMFLENFDLSPTGFPIGTLNTATIPSSSPQNPDTSLLLPPHPIPEPTEIFNQPQTCTSSTCTSSTSGFPSICTPFTTPNTAMDTTESKSTPCKLAYKFLQTINSRRKQRKDMFEIVLQLWNGFSESESGREEEGCRIDDKVLMEVAYGMMDRDIVII